MTLLQRSYHTAMTPAAIWAGRVGPVGGMAGRAGPDGGNSELSLYPAPEPGQEAYYEFLVKQRTSFVCGLIHPADSSQYTVRLAKWQSVHGY